MTNYPSWLDPSGKTTTYVIRAALHAASLLDERGSSKDDARESYWRHAIGGTFSPADLRLGEQMLADCGLIRENDGILYPAAVLQELLEGTVEDAVVFLATLAIRTRYEQHIDASRTSNQMESEIRQLISDPEKREQALIALSQRFDDSYRRVLGEIGEEIVLDAVRDELDGLGYPNLARAARRVSLLSDQLGYDISAPRIHGSSRLLEVKATIANPLESVQIYITRNEVRTAVNLADWYLIVCRILDVEGRTGEIIGWCNVSTFKELLPTDTEMGQWEQACLKIPLRGLNPGLPGPS